MLSHRRVTMTRAASRAQQAIKNARCSSARKAVALRPVPAAYAQSLCLHPARAVAIPMKTTSAAPPNLARCGFVEWRAFAVRQAAAKQTVAACRVHLEMRTARASLATGQPARLCRVTDNVNRRIPHSRIMPNQKGCAGPFVESHWHPSVGAAESRRTKGGAIPPSRLTSPMPLTGGVVSPPL